MTAHHGVRLLLAAAAGLGACSSASEVEGDTTEPAITADTMPLRHHAEARGRYIGAAVGTALTMPGDSGARLRAILAREFNMLWTGRFMKFDHLRPNRWTYNYTEADLHRGLRESPWPTLWLNIGTDYIEQAFRWARAVEIEGIYDGEAWVSDPTRWGAPVLFDIFMRPKPAYFAVQGALAER